MASRFPISIRRISSIPLRRPACATVTRDELSKPRHVLKGGYLTSYDPALRKWWHRAWFGGRSHKDEAIPIPSLVHGNIRSAVDRHLRDKHGIVKRTGGGASPKKPAAAFVNRAGDLRKAINART